MCLELRDDLIDELAMGRIRGTKEERNDVHGKCELIDVPWN
jgi:hypothetical protein